MLNNYLDKNGLSYFWEKIKTYVTSIARIGSPLVAAQASDMTDTSRIYVYMGNESGYTYGDWYYYNGSVWRDGGVYNAVAFETDETLTQDGAAADAKVTGDQIADVKRDLTDVTDIIGVKDYGLLAGYTFYQMNFTTEAPVTVTDNDTGITLSKNAWYNVTCQLVLTSELSSGTYHVKITTSTTGATTFLNYINGAVSGTDKTTENGVLEYDFDYTSGTWAIGLVYPSARNTPFDVSVVITPKLDDNILAQIADVDAKIPPYILGTYNTFFGVDAGKNTAEEQVTEVDDGRYNAAFGTSAMKANTTGDHNTAFGFSAMAYNTTGDCNTGFGEDALFGNTTGEYNTAVGVHALQNNNANGNTAMGCNAARYITSGAGNTIIGNQAASNILTGNNNVMIGDYVGNTGIDHSNCIIIGQALPTANGQIVIGNAHITALVFRFSDGYKKIVFNQDGTVTWEAFNT